MTSGAQAITWPVNWSTNDGANPGGSIWNPILDTNGLFYSDTMHDVTPDTVDIVGGTYQDHSTNGPFPAGFYFIDTTNIMFRVRYNNDPRSITAGGAVTNFIADVWGVYLNTDADPDVDFILQVDESGDGGLEMGIATSGGFTNNWDPVVVPATTHVSIAALDFTLPDPPFRVFNATQIDGSHYHPVPGPGSADFFIDMAIPWTFFTNYTGLPYLSSFEVALATSTTHTLYNDGVKDAPDGYWSATVAIPEPAAFAACAPLALLLAARRRLRRRA